MRGMTIIAVRQLHSICGVVEKDPAFTGKIEKGLAEDHAARATQRTSRGDAALAPAGLTAGRQDYLPDGAQVPFVPASAASSWICSSKLFSACGIGLLWA